MLDRLGHETIKHAVVVALDNMPVPPRRLRINQTLYDGSAIGAAIHEIAQKNDFGVRPAIRFDQLECGVQKLGLAVNIA